MRRTVTGLMLLLAGTAGLVAVYTYRPPAGLGEALIRMGQGRENFIEEPWYQILMGLSGLAVLLGLVLAAVSLARRE